MNNQPRKPKGTPVGGQFDRTLGGGAAVASLDEFAARPYDGERTCAWSSKIPNREIRLFTEGSCAELASALHQKTGFPPVVIKDINQYAEAEDAWKHCGIKLPDGRIADVEGIHASEAEWMERWNFLKTKRGFDIAVVNAKNSGIFNQEMKLNQTYRDAKLVGKAYGKTYATPKQVDKMAELISQRLGELF